MESKPGKVAHWLAGPCERLRHRPDAVRLCLSRADAAELVLPEAWSDAADALQQAAGEAAHLEVSAPESADRLIDVAVNELVRQGLRFLQLAYEKNGTDGDYVAIFLPARGDRLASPAMHVLRHEGTGQTWDLVPGKKLLLGRNSECDVRLDSPRVSSRHGSIHWVRRAFSLVDLRSSAGVFLDNQQIRRAVIEEFGRICLGLKETGHYLEMELRIPPGADAFLHVISGENKGQSIPLLQPVLTVGRSPECNLRIEAPYISREHLRIALLTDCWVLTDLASRNGTIHNGRPVPSSRLVPGDRIEAGDESFTFHSRAGLDGFYRPGWRLRAEGQETHLDRPYTTIGRDPGCDFLAGTAGLSRRHARLVWELTGRLKLHDLASFGGCRIDDRLGVEAELHAGTRVGLGSIEVQVLGPE